MLRRHFPPMQMKVSLPFKDIEEKRAESELNSVLTFEDKKLSDFSIHTCSLKSNLEVSFLIYLSKQQIDVVGGSSRAAAVSPRCKYNWREIKKKTMSQWRQPSKWQNLTGHSKRKSHVHHLIFLYSSCFYLGCQVDVYFQSRCLLPPAWIPLPMDSMAAGTLRHLAPPWLMLRAVCGSVGETCSIAMCVCILVSRQAMQIHVVETLYIHLWDAHL